MTIALKRVIYLIDCGSADDEVLRLLHALTDGHDVELVGLYVEDEDLARAISLPGLTEVSVARQQADPVDPARLQLSQWQ